jgi:hypothetical protein
MLPAAVDGAYLVVAVLTWLMVFIALSRRED